MLALHSSLPRHPRPRPGGGLKFSLQPTRLENRLANSACSNLGQLFFVRGQPATGGLPLEFVRGQPAMGGLPSDFVRGQPAMGGLLLEFVLAQPAM